MRFRRPLFLDTVSTDKVLTVLLFKAACWKVHRAMVKTYTHH